MRGVVPPERATLNRPRAAMAAAACFTNEVAACRARSSAVGNTRMTRWSVELGIEFQLRDDVERHAQGAFVGFATAEDFDFTRHQTRFRQLGQGNRRVVARAAGNLDGRCVEPVRAIRRVTGHAEAGHVRSFGQQDDFTELALWQSLDHLWLNRHRDAPLAGAEAQLRLVAVDLVGILERPAQLRGKKPASNRA